MPTTIPQTAAVREELRSIGLTGNEASVYVALLEMGGGFPSKIAEVVKFNRSTTYAILMDLAVKGLVLEMRRRNKLYYQVERPSKLVRYAKERVRMAEDAVEKASKILPDIEGLFSLIPNKPKMRFFEGFPEVLEVHEDHVAIQKKYEQLAWANGTGIAAFLPLDVKRNYLRKKEKLGITLRMIAPDTLNDRSYDQKVYKGISKAVWPKMKYIPTEKFPYPCEITIYGTNKVSVLNFSKDHPVGLIIEDQIIHDMMAMIFETSWNGAKA